MGINNMNNKINTKTTSIIAITLIAAIGLGSMPMDVDGFMQYASKPDWKLYPGESDSFNWGVISNGEDEVGTVEIVSGGGNGDKFLTFPESVEIEANRSAFIPITVTIPEDYASPHYYNPDGDYYDSVVRAYSPKVVTGSGNTIYVTMGFVNPIIVLPHYCGQPESFYDNTIIGTNSSDYLQGTKNADLIFGYGGNDFIRGLQGNDCIFGGEGNDFIQAGMGDDTIYAGNGNDHVNSGGGSDTGYGEDGDDILIAGLKPGTNILDGGTGFDMCGPTNDRVTLNSTNCEITTPTN
jgi:Ca2+-binding RTX toxin-like protein